MRQRHVATVGLSRGKSPSLFGQSGPELGSCFGDEERGELAEWRCSMFVVFVCNVSICYVRFADNFQACAHETLKLRVFVRMATHPPLRAWAAPVTKVR